MSTWKIQVKTWQRHPLASCLDGTSAQTSSPGLGGHEFGFGINGGKDWTDSLLVMFRGASFWREGCLYESSHKILVRAMNETWTPCFLNNCCYGAPEQSKKLWLYWIATGPYLCELKIGCYWKRAFVLSKPTLGKQGLKRIYSHYPGLSVAAPLLQTAGLKGDWGLVG